MRRDVDYLIHVDDDDDDEYNDEYGIQNVGGGWSNAGHSGHGRSSLILMTAFIFN